MPTLSGTPTSIIDAGADTTYSFNMPATGDRRAVVVEAFAYDTTDTATISGVTYDGVAMTKVGSTVGDVDGAVGIMESFILVNPATGANDVVVTCSEFMVELSSSASGWVDVNQTTPTSAHETATGSSASPDTTPTVSGSDVGIGMLSFFGSATNAATASDTELTADSATGASSGIASQYGDGTLSWTLDGTADWLSLGFALTHDAGGATASGTPSIDAVTASGVAAIVSNVQITDVNTTESWTDGDTGLVITGSGFV